MTIQNIQDPNIAKGFQALMSVFAPNSSSLIDADMKRREGARIDADTNRIGVDATRLAADRARLEAEAARTSGFSAADAAMADILSDPAFDPADPAWRRRLAGAAAGTENGMADGPGGITGFSSYVDPYFAGDEQGFSNILTGTGVVPDYANTPSGQRVTEGGLDRRNAADNQTSAANNAATNQTSVANNASDNAAAWERHVNEYDFRDQWANADRASAWAMNAADNETTRGVNRADNEAAWNRNEANNQSAAMLNADDNASAAALNTDDNAAAWARNEADNAAMAARLKANGGRTGPPIRVTPETIADFAELLTGRIDALFPGAEALDPALEQGIMTDALAAYQRTGNADAAIAEVLSGLTATTTDESYLPTGDTTRISRMPPPAAAAPSAAPPAAAAGVLPPAAAPAAAAPAAAPAAPPRTATNPKTGQKVYFDEATGAWKPLGPVKP